MKQSSSASHHTVDKTSASETAAGVTFFESASFYLAQQNVLCHSVSASIANALVRVDLINMNSLKR